jgi:peptide chain release factor subunit 1
VHLPVLTGSISAGDTDIKHLSNEQAADDSHFKDKDGNILEVQEKLSMLEWLANNYKKFGCALEFVSNKSQEGSQFCRGFGGIGGLLRYAVDLSEFEVPEDNGEEFWNSDEDI